MVNIAILGCGPSGLLAMHACVRAGYDPDIYSHKFKSRIYAAMFLHKSIPEVCPDRPELKIRILKTGTREGYAQNVYGDPQHEVSWDKFQTGFIDAWSLPNAYDKLWALYSHRITDMDAKDLLRTELKAYDLVISTIPRPILCYRDHVFHSQRVWVRHEQTEMRHNLMVYNGSTVHTFYRYSVIGGHRSYEYSFDPGPRNGFEVAVGYKPLWTTCDCRPKIVKLGRFGAWEKQILCHQVYEETFGVLQSLR
jgi:hypothetical protein